jgi:flagellar motor protein MotB
MERHSGGDHLASSLTDLMTSLMVIFILLLLVFVSHSASKDATATDMLLKQLKLELKPQHLHEDSVRLDPRDRNAILVIVPDRLMNFQTGSADLSEQGKGFLGNFVPALASSLCAGDVQRDVDSIVVEGHTDAAQYKQDSVGQNLRLSQNRSMSVVQASLHDLEPTPGLQDCFLEKLSATGRGQQDLQPTPEESRRVIFRIRVKATAAPKVDPSLSSGSDLIVQKRVQ